jgi:chitin synthase
MTQQQQEQQQQQQQPVHVSDLTQLPRDPSSDEIAELLRQRYLNDLIYTNIGSSVLIALNPYHYNNTVKADYIAEYKDTSSAKANQWKEPHIYQLVNHAYLHMRRTSINQSILFR